MSSKGVILCGGTGTRLRPVTYVTNKHLVPIINNPMVLYPLNTLKALGIDDVLIVSGGEHIGDFAEFFKDGSEYGVSMTYRVQNEAGGIAQALGLAKDFYQGTDDKVVVILGDNIFDNESIKASWKWDVPPLAQKDSASIFVKYLPPEEATRFGVVFNVEGRRTILEKPPLEKLPQEAPVVTGLYVYPSDVFEVIKTLKPSARGELEITDVNNHYLEKGKCGLYEIKGFWSDAGTPKSLYEAIKWEHTVSEISTLSKD